MTHSLKNLAVFFDGSNEGLHIPDIASRMASEHGAHLIGMISASDRYQAPADTLARGDAINEVIQRRKVIQTDKLIHAGQALANRSSQYGIVSEFRVIGASETGGQSALQALLCDVLILGHPSAPGIPSSWSLPKMLQHMGLSVMVIPAGWEGNIADQRITVAWNASKQARRALSESLSLLIQASAVQLLIVDADEHPDLHGEMPGAEVTAFLTRHGVKTELYKVSSQGGAIASVIASEATILQSELIVFGAWSHSRVTEALLGGVTKTLLKHVPCPLFISH